MQSFDKNIKIGSTEISQSGNKVFVIAEAGVNHGGDMDLALKLIDIAANAGADAVKFQAFRTEHLILDDVQKAAYQKKTTDASQSQFEMLKGLEVTREQNLKLKNYAESKGIIFLTTPFEEASLDELDELGLEAYKIASTDTTNIPFLRKVAQKGKPIFLSTGMTYMDELEIVLKEIGKINTQLVLLQCTANYPIIDDEANLLVMNKMAKTFDMILGYSDHTVGVGAAPYAIPMGARVVEKHFTWDKSLEGPDHKASLSPDELKDFVTEVRRVEKFLGHEQKLPTLAETYTRKSLQKCLVAAKPIAKGAIIKEDDIIAKRTGGEGISPLYCDVVVGKTAACDHEINQVLTIEN